MSNEENKNETKENTANKSFDELVGEHCEKEKKKMQKTLEEDIAAHREKLRVEMFEMFYPAINAARKRFNIPDSGTPINENPEIDIDNVSRTLVAICEMYKGRKIKTDEAIFVIRDLFGKDDEPALVYAKILKFAITKAFNVSEELANIIMHDFSEANAGYASGWSRIERIITKAAELIPSARFEYSPREAMRKRMQSKTEALKAQIFLENHSVEECLLQIPEFRKHPSGEEFANILEYLLFEKTGQMTEETRKAAFTKFFTSSSKLFSRENEESENNENGN